MGEVISCCSCSGVQEKSKAAYKVLFKDNEVPEMIVGTDKVRAFANGFPSESNLNKHLNAITKKNGRYSYLVQYDDALDITYMYDLLTGKKVY